MGPGAGRGVRLDDDTCACDAVQVSRR
jgi:hypothetical protein